jgi:hypothetical protein
VTKLRQMLNTVWLYAYPHTLVTTYANVVDGVEGPTMMCAWRQWGRRIWSVQRGVLED